MPNAYLERLRAVYEAAVQLDPEERPEFLDKACKGDQRLRTDVEALIRAESQDFETALVLTGQSGDDVEGRAIGHYIIRRVLGRGGMGVVYLADDTRLSRPVALKAIAPNLSVDPVSRSRLLQEARAAAGLSHSGIATVYAVEEIDGDVYLSTEYVPGESLRALLTNGPLPITQVVAIGAQLVEALAVAHTKGVIHRDIKPENVLKTPGGAVKILDFGLARVEGSRYTNLTRTGVVMGTPAYMAPEQALGDKVDFRADVFAVGVLLYELASGKNPFASGSLESTIGRIVTAEAPLLSQTLRENAPGLVRIVAACLQKEPSKRYRSTGDLLADLRAVQAGMPPRGEVAVKATSESHMASVATMPRWWEFHQVIMSMIYVLMIYPAWYAQRWSWPPQPWGMIFLLVVLATAAVGTTVRFHLWFIARHAAGKLSAQLRQSHNLKRCSDVGFALTLLVAAPVISSAHREFAMLFVVIAAITLVAAFVIEPATEDAAFGTNS